VIPPEHTAEFVACMEDVLEVYRRPYDPQRPVICLDEQPTQLIGETRTPIPLQPGQAQRHEDDYARIGTADTFMIVEPLAGRRKVGVRATKTALDLGQEIKELLDVDDPETDKVVPVWDTLDTHAPASLYNAFPPWEARRLLDRLKIHDTPKTRQLARQRRARARRLHQAVSGSAYRQHRHPAQRGQGLGGSPQCFRGRCRLAVHDRQCTHHARTPLSAT
jgi:hypothetical protein